MNYQAYFVFHLLLWLFFSGGVIGYLNGLGISPYEGNLDEIVVLSVPSALGYSGLSLYLTQVKIDERNAPESVSFSDGLVMGSISFLISTATYASGYLAGKLVL